MRGVRLLVAAMAGYVLGTVPSADTVSRVAGGSRVDLRAAGSRNPGALNSARLLGIRHGRAVLVADVAKGYASCAIGRGIAGDLGAHVAGVSAVAGHCYPAWNGFAGGKGLATSFGQVLYTFPAAAPVDLALAIGVARIPNLPRAGVVSTAAASTGWLLMSLVWWRKRLPNSWGPEPSAGLFFANCATAAIVWSRFLNAHRLGHPDELEPS